MTAPLNLTSDGTPASAIAGPTMPDGSPAIVAVGWTRVSRTEVRITASEPMTREEFWTYCGEQGDFGYPAAGYGGYCSLVGGDRREDDAMVSTEARYTHYLTCD